MGPSGESQLASLASGRSVDLDFERPLLSGEGKRYQCHALSFDAMRSGVFRLQLLVR